MQKKFVSITGLIVIAVLVLAVNLLGYLLFRGAKVDMTEEKLYTLSEGSKEILDSLEDHISARVYFSRKALNEVPVLKNYGNRVLEMLEEFESHSDGKLSLEVLDPRPDTEVEEWAERYGLQSMPANGMGRIYLGAVFKDESGNEKVIPFFHPDKEQTLEYDIAKALNGLADTEKKTIGVLSSLNVTGEAPEQNPMMMRPQDRPKPWMFIRELQKNFKVEKLDTELDAVPAKVDMLLVIHPKDFPEKTRYAIDQYVLAGGKAMVFVDPFCEADREASPMDNPQMMMQASFSSNLPDLFKAWGIEMEGGSVAPAAPGRPAADSAQIVADPNLAYRVRTRQGEQDVYVWLELDERNLNNQEIITSQLENLLLAAPGALKKISTSEAQEIVPLMESTEEANTIQDMRLKFGMNPEELRKNFEPGSSKIAMAYKITGTFKTAFPDGKPGDGEEKEKGLTESTEPGTVVVVSDVDMISNRYSVQVQNFLGQELAMAINDNLAFTNNAIEYLSGSSALISLRSRGRSHRPFTKVEEIEKKAQESWREKEEQLNAKLEAANQRLNELQRGNEEKQILNEAFMAEIKQLRDERAETRGALRDVRRKLREDVEALAFKVKFINIALIPLIVVFAGVAIAIVRSMRKQKN